MERTLQTLVVLSLLTVGACGGAESEPEADGTPTQTQADSYVGRGVIQEVRDGQLVIQHSEIPELMGAMTMPYAVAPDVDIERFAAGDEVRFELEVPEPNQYLIVRIDSTGSGDRP